MCEVLELSQQVYQHTMKRSDVRIAVKRAEAMVDARIVTEGSQATCKQLKNQEAGDACNGWHARRRLISRRTLSLIPETKFETVAISEASYVYHSLQSII